jgi:hypothetical protein
MTHTNSLWTIEDAHPGVKTSVGRGKPEIIPGKHKNLNAFKLLSPRPAENKCKSGLNLLANAPILYKNTG